MKKIIRKAALTIVLLLAVIFCALPAGAEGNSYTVSFSVTVSTPKNNISGDIRVTLVIEGQPHAPLPDPCEISAEVNGTYAFQPIEFTEPGNYKYIIKQLAPDDGNFIPDNREYEIDVTVIRNESGDLEGGFTLSDHAGSGKPRSIAFHNDYKYAEVNSTDETSSDDTPGNVTSQDEKTPHTGEPLSPAFGGLIFSCALFVLFLIVRKKRTNSANSDVSCNKEVSFDEEK